jgi:rsbT co-antagonist protein RsbR
MFRKTSRQLIDDNQDAISKLWEQKRLSHFSSYKQPIEAFFHNILKDGFLRHLSDFFSEDEETRTQAMDRIEKSFYVHVPICTEADVPVSDVIQSFYFIREIILEMDEPQQNPTRLIDLVKEADGFFFHFNKVIHDIYASSWKNKILAHRSAIMELSAPLIPVLENIAVMPIIGAIDTERAELITQNLLYGAIKYESKVVLVDITGVAEVNTMVAQYIIKAAEAIHLIGAECIVVGIRPEIAQTMMSLEVDMDMLTTLSSMDQGLRVALSKTGKKITDIHKGGI